MDERENILELFCTQAKVIASFIKEKLPHDVYIDTIHKRIIYGIDYFAEWSIEEVGMKLFPYRDDLLQHNIDGLLSHNFEETEVKKTKTDEKRAWAEHLLPMLETLIKSGLTKKERDNCIRAIATLLGYYLKWKMIKIS